MSYGDIGDSRMDADIEMAGLVATANRARRLRKMGICCHGWSGPVEFGKPARRCNDCGKVFASDAEMEEERRENLI